MATAMPSDATLQKQREELACALRWAARHGFQEGVDNHFSLAVAGDDGQHQGDLFLVNPYGFHWSEVTASSLVLCNAEGEVLQGDHQVEDTAFFIHSRIHLAVPHAAAVLHTHMPYATALTLRKGGKLAMCEQNALMFRGRIAYDDTYNGLALDNTEGDRMAATIGQASVLFLAGHGVIVMGPSIARAYTELYYLERAAQAQVLAASNGSELIEVDEAVQIHTAQQMERELPILADRHFSALRRMLERDEPEFLN